MLKETARKAIRECLTQEGFDKVEFIGEENVILQNQVENVALMIEDWIKEYRISKKAFLSRKELLGVFKQLVNEFSQEKYQEYNCVPELVLREAEETRQKHSHGNFNSMNRDGLD